MKVKIIVVFLLVVFSCGCAFAATNEAKTHNFLTEFDITFWQTMPWACFWGYAIGTQINRGGSVDWNTILALSAGISAANGWMQAKKVVGQTHN